MKNIFALKINEGLKLEAIEIDIDNLIDNIEKVLKVNCVDSRLVKINDFCYMRIYFQDYISKDDVRFYSVVKATDKENYYETYIPNECLCFLFDPALDIKEIMNSEEQEKLFISINSAFYTFVLLKENIILTGIDNELNKEQVFLVIK